MSSEKSRTRFSGAGCVDPHHAGNVRMERTFS
jgi:hypothetical protein